MTSKFKPSVQDIRLGALYRLGAKRRFNREMLERGMIQRCGLKADTAKVLAGHWLTTEPFRRPRPLSPS